jgi:hypothetical protein
MLIDVLSWKGGWGGKRCDGSDGQRPACLKWPTWPAQRHTGPSKDVFSVHSLNYFVGR